jgi:hypothetical protein
MKPITARFLDARWTRRQLVQGLGFGALGLGLPDLLRIRAEARPADLTLRSRDGRPMGLLEETQPLPLFA